MLHKKVDIIIPVYNKAIFLNPLFNCLEKLPVQTFNIILVDDGSNDDSYKIIDELIKNKKLKNFFLYKKNNGGVSSARNYGLDLSVSEYIWFFDPDDQIDQRFFYHIDIIEKLTEDIVVFNYSIKDLRSGGIKNQKFNKYGLMKKNDFMVDHDALLSKTKNMNYVWNKLYKRVFLKDINFDEKLHLGEDRKFNLQLFSKDGSVVVFDVFLYCYYIYETGTLSRGLNMNKIENIYDVNILNISKMKSCRDIIKAHIIDQLKIRTMAQCGGGYSFYENEHKKFNIKICPFYSFQELILFIMAFLGINVIFYRFFSFLKRIKFNILKKYHL